MKHDDLAWDLACARTATGDVAATKVGLGLWGGRGEADVVSLSRSRRSQQACIWEVKVSRADFLADVRARKYERYRALCDRLWFATPKGLVDPREVPEGCGLVWRGPNGWYTRRAAPLHRMAPDQRSELLTSLLLRLVHSPWNGAWHSRFDRLSLASEADTRKAYYEVLHRAAPAFGHRLASAARAMGVA